MRQAIQKAKAHDFTGAVADFARVLEVPDVLPETMANALAYRADARRQSGDFEGAIADLSTFVNLPDDVAFDKPNARNYLARLSLDYARVLIERGNPEQAIRHCAAVLKLPNIETDYVTVAMLTRSRAKLDAGDLEGAVADFTALTRAAKDAALEFLNKSLLWAHVKRGQLRFRAGDASGAISDFTTVLRAAEVDAENRAFALVGRAHARQHLEDTDGAMADSIECLMLPGELRDVKDAARRLLSALVCPDWATDSYTAILDRPDLAPRERATAHLIRALGRHEAGDLNHAIGDYVAVLDTAVDAPRAALVASVLLCAMPGIPAAIRSRAKAMHAELTRRSQGRPLAGCGETTPSPPKNFAIVKLNPSDGELAVLLKAQVSKAKESGRKPFVEFYADWCGPCKALRGSLDDARMIEAFDGTYIVQLDADAWKSKLSGSGFSVSAIPVFFEINHEGKPTGRRIDGGAWRANTPPNMAPPLKKFFKG